MQLLTTREAAAAIGCTPRWVRILAKRRRLGTVQKLGGRLGRERLLLTPEEVEAVRRDAGKGAR